MHKWSSQLDPRDTFAIDISPGNIGNIAELPNSFEEYKSFYSEDGGDWSRGHELNPSTQEPYLPQIIPRGDYTRVLAEFWADGPDSETPPGHWFTIFNYVQDQPEFERKYNGSELLGVLEYDVKGYFLLGGALHDAAIAAWSVKGYYDYIRPISAIRYMAQLGQSSDSSLTNYHKNGLPLEPDYVELVREGDLLFDSPEYLGKIKIRSWRGPNYIENPELNFAGVDWILADDWWPYQRPSFITPPFAGYVSGHSTFSRAAAEVLTFLTGDPFFPGGVGIFEARKDEFLVFENGPSEDVTLQWATYRDASDQCSLSRIWGGIHPPADDIPGRRMGIFVAQKAIRTANYYFNGESSYFIDDDNNKSFIFPNPANMDDEIWVSIDGQFNELFIFNSLKKLVHTENINGDSELSLSVNLEPGLYYLVLYNNGSKVTRVFLVI